MSDALRDEELRVLETVRHDARLSIREIAGRAGLPETTARDILHRLERNSVVLGYRALVDPKAIGATMRAWIVLRLPGERADKAIETITSEPGVERTALLPDRPDNLAVWLAAPDGNALAVKLARWAASLGVRVEESHPLCGLDEPTRQDLRDEAADRWFTILKQDA